MILGAQDAGEPDDTLLGKARRYAALLGNFEPLALMDRIGAMPRGTGGAGELETILDQLSRDCDEIETASRVYWRLQPDARRIILAGLEDSAALKQTADAVRDLARDDFGTILVSLSGGEVTDLGGSGDMAELGALDSALSFLGDSDRRRGVQAQIQREETEEAFRFILPGDLIGRDAELEDLRAFIYDGRPATPGMPDLFLLSGNGGAGKSALLAELARRELALGERGTPIIWLDLDRPLLASTDPLTLMLELARQLALFWPDRRTALDRFRSEAAHIGIGGSHDESDYGGEALLSAAFSLWREYLGSALPATQPVVIIIDTFEEVLLHGAWNADRIERWLEGLALEGGLANLRPVISGRAFDDVWRKRICSHVVGEIRLEGLPPPAAAQLLGIFLGFRNVQPERFDIPRLTEKYGGNPLVLKILAQYLADEGPDAERDLLEGEGGGHLQDELAQQYLYTRILSRIRADNPDLVKLAFPGLALRRITADLILHVLGEPCDIEVGDLQVARDLLAELSRQVWLVEPDGNTEVVRHRGDLRRLMLRTVPTAKQAIMRRIHRRAADYYGKRRAAHLDESAQLLESAYHHAMAGKLVERLTDPVGARSFLDALGEDAESLPIALLARLKFLADRLLAAQETAALEADEQSQVHEKELLSGITAGYRPDDFGRDWQSSSVELHAADAFLSGDLSALVSMADAAFERDFFDSRLRKRPVKAFTECASWRVAMASLALGQQRHVSERLTERIRWEFAPSDPQRPFVEGARGSPTQGEVMTALLRLLGEDEPIHERGSADWRGRGINSMDELRLSQIVRRGRVRGPSLLSLALVRSLRRETIAWLERDTGLAPSAREQFSLWRERLNDGQRLSLGQVQALGRQGSVETPDGWTALLGEHCLLRELYLPIERCAAEASTEALLTASARVAEQAYAWPKELSGKQLTSYLDSDRKRWISTLVEMVDRAGGLWTFVRAFTAEVPNAQYVMQMVRSYGDRLEIVEQNPGY